MRKYLLISFLVFALLVVTGPNLQGAGFLIYEHGAAAMAMAGAFISVANNPSAVFHNPAGIAWLKGTQVSLGSTLITSQSNLELPHWPDPTYQSINQESQIFYPSTIYITRQLSDRIVAGFGFFSPYGLGTKWPKDYPLKYIAYEDDMKTFFFNPTLAYKVSDRFSIGFGVSFIQASIKFKLVQIAEIIPGVLEPDIPAQFEASGNSFGFNAGLLYQGDSFSFGLNWRSGFKIDFEGDITLDSSGVPAPFNAFVPHKGTARTSFRFPHILGAGISSKVTDRFLIAFDVNYILWSTYDAYTVNIDYQDPYPDPEPMVVPEDWKDSLTLRLGFEYKTSPNLALRWGVLYDQTPQPAEHMDPVLPDANRWALTAGFGYNRGNFALDISYQLELFGERTSPNRNIYYFPSLGMNLGEGTYSTTAHLIGISLGFVF